MSSPPRCRHGVRPALLMTLAALGLAGCTPRGSRPAPSPTASLNERLAALAARQTVFGAISLIPVRFEHSRVSKPFVDEGRTLYCVSSRMKGRTFGKAERPKVIIQDTKGVLTVVDEDNEVCEGHRTDPLPELDTPVAGKNPTGGTGPTGGGT
ncbi:hypothetical protein [Methylobacterium sp. J-068]|uniref:hypothetical protein n=1 Tax=Methylobacterium sp. J-068 TaxID=2836649 RepID=UPI001FB9FF9C|nr:hypothetical protein [Methylobacterium sp. J-068]MCJ2036867.1 hypothetical protein [Methylobacterium sp. J-068]